MLYILEHCFYLLKPFRFFSGDPVHISPERVCVCRGCSVSHRQTYLKWSQCFEEENKLLQNGISNFTVRLFQSSGIALKIYADEKPRKKGLRNCYLI